METGTIPRRALALLEATTPSFLVNHSRRSYYWAVEFAHLDGIAFDPEVLYVAALLHDLGLVPALDSGAAFEADGAAWSRAMWRGWGGDMDKADVVAEAVRLHVAAGVPTAAGPEACLLWHATSLDVGGARHAEVPRATIREVLQRFPRLGFAPQFAGLFTDQASRKPETRAAHLVASGILERMSACPLDDPGHRTAPPSRT